MPPIRPELLDALLKDYQKPEDLLCQDGPLHQLTKALVVRALDGELTHHPGHDKHNSAGTQSKRLSFALLHQRPGVNQSFASLYLKLTHYPGFSSLPPPAKNSA